MPGRKTQSGWFIYALGGGWGHLNRALALAQVAAKDRPIHLLVNSPYTKRVTEQIAAMGELKNLSLHQLPSHISVQAARASVSALLKSVAYDCLVVDTFPRGLVGDLAEIIPAQSHICQVLVHRDLNPDYMAAKAIATFTRQYYDGILIPGEFSPPLAHLPQVQVTAPWLSRSASDLPNAEAMRVKWNISAKTPLVIVCGGGQPDELAFLGQVTEQVAKAFSDISVRCLAATCPPTCTADRWLYHWPGMDVLQLADVVIGGGGYNLTYECQALNKPLIAFAWPRRYDRQSRRIQAYGCRVNSVDQAIAALGTLLKALPSKSSDTFKADYENGVFAAIAHIQHWQQQATKLHSSEVET